jgi:hypothetical protein
MDRDAISRFQGKHVKLVQKNNFVLSGVIDEVYGNSLLFRTCQGTSLISFDVITEIMLLNSKNR